jgi:thiamine-phosphate pyrophosphorylase
VNMKDNQLFADLRLLAVVGPPFVSTASVLESCLAAEAGGVTAVQVRWKSLPASELLSLTERLVGSLSVPVYVNDRADVALVCGAAGVHVGTDDLDPSRVRTMAPRPFRIGVSVGSEEEAAAVLGADVDYWSLGSIYHTNTKGNAGEPIGIAGFKRLAALAPADMPVIAIGGIDRSNVGDVLGAGAQGVAVVSAIFGSADVERKARELRAIIDETLPCPSF